ncbi:hypothetical protein CYQ88_07770 [Hydrogenovibrio sp. SC-1]|uniref:hypothetical protein n=1 Tax=Hydrogenovibrio sp. SC-1 TaxID=2065820 RepID=UPI000C7D7EC4|nr:hypothetical protein [Hydrogenovibrio sp. SC-1]PLA74130.1 hypothetical protein CYQ88_07770 [Hydrogenovibrio sp. SC-1]
MKRRVLIAFGVFVLFISGCSIQFSQPQNAWQVKAVSAFQNYQKYYLEGRVILAESERRKAISQAKQSAKLETLARVYIADCAIQAAVLNASDCALYLQVKPLVNAPELEAYYHFLSGSLSASEVDKLPSQYHGFAKKWQSGKTTKLDELVLAISPLESQLVSASIAKEMLTLKTLRAIIQTTADYGYKLASIRWMTYLSDRTPDADESAQLLKKIEILTKDS